MLIKMNQLELTQFREDYLAILTDNTPEGPEAPEADNKGPAGRCFAFTINNPTVECMQNLREIGAKYANGKKIGEVLIWELEVGWGRKLHKQSDGTMKAGERTLHVQGYIEVPTKLSLAQLSTKLKTRPDHIATDDTGKVTPWCTPARYGVATNRFYCSKDRSHPEFKHLYTEGVHWACVDARPHPPSSDYAGKRNDIESFKNDVKEGMSEAELKDVHTELFMRYQAGCRDIIKTFAPKREKPKLVVHWHWGLSRTGKTHAAVKMYGDAETYIKTVKTGFWHDGYDPDVHKCVILDEVDKNTYAHSLENLLNILDDYTTRVQRKGDCVVFRPNLVVLTSTVHPQTLYAKETDWHQVRNRLDKIVQFVGRIDAHAKNTIEETVYNKPAGDV
jgi:hypothetical protein